MKRVVLNVAVPGGGHGDAWYQKGQQRLAESLDRFNEPADRLFFTEWPNTPNQEIPYKFKVDAFLIARDQGYDQAIWLDSSTWLAKPLDQAWATLTEQGHFFGQDGWTVGQWCNEQTLDKAGITREEADGMELMAGTIMGIDLTSKIGNEFLDAWHQTALDGWFHGSHADHRHDITAGSIIAHRMGIKLLPHLIEYARGKNPPSPEVYICASGIGL